MKKLFLSVTLILLILPSADAVDPFTVRTIYFQPTDAPDAPDNLIPLLLETQDFYRAEMERHGYGAKTFRHETNANGAVGYHVIKGQHPAFHYLSNTYNQMLRELPIELRRINFIGQNNIHIFVAGGLDLVDTTKLGVGFPYSEFHSGGNAVIAGNRLDFRIMAHELGHAFGLFHTGSVSALMGPGSDELLDYETRWLAKHHFFNDTHIKNDLPEAVLDFPLEAISGGTIKFKVAVRSDSGLYHTQLCRKRETYILGYDIIAGQSDVIEINASRGRLLNGDDVWLQIMDINGNYIFHHLDSVVFPDTKPKPNTNKNPEIATRQPEPEPDPIPDDKAVDCPDCEPDAIEDETPIEKPRRVTPTPLQLTTQWARLKRF